MAELRYVVGFWNPERGECLWELRSVVAPPPYGGPPTLEFEGKVYLAARTALSTSQVIQGVQSAIYEHTRALGVAVKVPPFAAVAIVEVHDG